MKILVSLKSIRSTVFGLNGTLVILTLEEKLLPPLVDEA